MIKILSGKQRALLTEVIEKQKSSLYPIIDKIDTGVITNEERSLLVEAITQEFCATGIGHDEEPNERGLLLEALLDALNPIR